MQKSKEKRRKKGGEEETGRTDEGVKNAKIKEGNLEKLTRENSRSRGRRDLKEGVKNAKIRR